MGEEFSSGVKNANKQTYKYSCLIVKLLTSLILQRMYLRIQNNAEKPFIYRMWIFRQKRRVNKIIVTTLNPFDYL